MSDGVDKFFIVYYDLGAMHFLGSKTLNELAALAMLMESYKTEYRERIVAHIRGMNEFLVQYDAEMKS